MSFTAADKAIMQEAIDALRTRTPLWQRITRQLAAIHRKENIARYGKASPFTTKRQPC